MTPTLPPDLDREIAAVPRAAWIGFPHGERINRHIARSEGFNESLAHAWDQGVYGLFDEMEMKDAHLYSVLQTRKNGALARARRVEPASALAQDQEIARWVEGALAALPRWEGALAHLLDCLAKGMAVAETIWGYDAQGRIVPTAIKPRGAWRFGFGADGALRLNDGAIAGGAAGTTFAERTGQQRDTNRATRRLQSSDLSTFIPQPSSYSSGAPLPPRKFLVSLFSPSDDRPYGRGLCERVYWYWWFKKNNLKFWVMYNEKFGAPTMVAKHRAGLSQPERDRLLEVIASLQADAGVTVPEGITLELLESARRGSAETYRDLANWCNEEISRAVLGQTLTVSEGSRGGSLAMARVHEAVRLDYVRADACLLMDAVNSQLIRWMIDFNFGERVPAPRWTIDLTPDIDSEVEARIDRQLLQMGVPLPLKHFYDTYGRPAPAAGERLLRYDDNNLFQYHLQFGVLTVNEVRSSLGLSPVPWGDEPTSLAAARFNPPTPGQAASDAPPSFNPPEGRRAPGDDRVEEEEAEMKRELRREK